MTREEAVEAVRAAWKNAEDKPGQIVDTLAALGIIKLDDDRTDRKPER